MRCHTVITDWPPGPRAGWGGWGLLAELSRDPLAVLARWRASMAMVHRQVWPLHQVVISDPALLHEVLVKQCRGADALAARHAGVWPVYGHSVFIAEGQAWRDGGGRWRRGFPGRRRRMPRRRWPRPLGEVLTGWPSAHPAWRADQALPR